MQPGQQKISQFDPVTSTQSGDIIPIVRNGQNKRITVDNFSGLVPDGFISAAQVWSFSSWSSTTNVGIITVPSDATTKYSEGMFVRITQTTGGTKYGVIITVTTTSISVWMPGYTLTNEGVGSPFVSSLAHPYGVPMTIAEGNPYKFSGWRNATASVNGADTVIAMDTKDYDSLNLYNSGTGYFTAPKAGYYNLQGQITGTANTSYQWASLFVNGVLRRRGSRLSNSPSAQSAVYGNIYLNAGDTLAIGFATGNNNPLEVAKNYLNYCDIWLTSRG